MRVVVVLVSSDQSACELFHKEKEALIPRSLRMHDRIRSVGFEFVTSVYNPASAKGQIQDHVLHVARNAEVVALLVDSTWEARIAPVARACFVGRVDFDPYATNYKNLIQATLTKLVKNLASLASHMSSAGSRNALLLPLRNFIAQELDALQELFHQRTLSSEFLPELEQLIAQLNDRKRPRRRSNSCATYFVDDQERLFDYGKEHHSSIATGAPHTSMCVLTGHFRFGARIPTDQHYNVTKEVGALTKISGAFTDCHDVINEVAERSHLNLFPNDYHV